MTKNKITLVAAGFLASTLFSHSQSYSDDFESYNVGDFICQQSNMWDPWTAGQEKGNQDVKIVEVPVTNSKGLFMSSTSANGGPQDVVLLTDSLYNTGTFDLSMDLYIDSGKGAYFNIQSDTIPGKGWTLHFRFLPDSNAIIYDGSGKLHIQTAYEQGKWFTLGVESNLSTNNWDVMFNSMLKGSFFNESVAIGSINYYPLLNSSFYLDNLNYAITEDSLTNKNGAITNLGLTGGLISGLSGKVSGTIRNLGVDTIKSFDITYTYNGVTDMESVSAKSIGSLEFYKHTFAQPIILVANQKQLAVTISNINGTGTDSIPSDDSKTTTLNIVQAGLNKAVLGEEATGTWCGFCPRGSVWMNNMEEWYKEKWIGIAVHNGDPMTVTNYDSELGAVTGGGYPKATIDRDWKGDPSKMEAPFLNQIVNNAIGTIKAGANYDEQAGVMNVSLTVHFAGDANNKWGLACALVEDSVTGTGSDWDQANYFAGGQRGAMGGYESLPNPVPAAQMVYRHVARAISPSFAGETKCFPESIKSGDSETINYKFQIPSDWKSKHIHIVGILVNEAGKIDNASETSIPQAETNGYVKGCDTLTNVQYLGRPDDIVKLYPNPSSGITNLTLNVTDSPQVNIRIINSAGYEVFSKSISNVSQAIQLPISTSNFAKGIYQVQVVANGNSYIKNLSVQ